MGWIAKWFGRKGGVAHAPAAVPVVGNAGAPPREDSFVGSCLDLPQREEVDGRWSSHFDELPRIDALRREGDAVAALELCETGLARHPDSFLFYGRAADLYDDLDRPDDAARVLLEGLERSRSKCSLAQALADRAFECGDHREAVRWWIRSGVLQLDAGILVDRKPFLNLAYVCEPLGLPHVRDWLLETADRAGQEGPVRFDNGGATMRHRVGEALRAHDDGPAVEAIRALHARYSV